MKYVASFFLSIGFFFLFSTGAFAQNVSTKGVEQPPRQEFAVVADVNVTDVVVTEKNGTFSGSFALQDKMGMQSDIVYGIIVYDNKNTIVDVQKLGEEKFLHEGEIKRYPVSYTIPPSLLGVSVTVTVQAFTKDGLTLGLQVIGKKIAVKEITRDNLSCISEKGECSTAKLAVVTVQALSSNPFGEASPVVTYSTKDGESFNPSALLGITKPGVYYLLLEDTTYHVKRMVRFTTPGEFMTIQNIAVDYTQDNKVTIVGTIFGSVFQGNVVITVKDLKGSIVLDITTALNGPIFSDTFTSPVKEGTVHVKILSKNDTSKVLAEKESPFSLLSYQEYMNASNQPKTSISDKKSNGGLLIGLITLLVIIGVILYSLKYKYMINGRKASIFVVFAIVSFCSFGLGNADAATIVVYHYNYSFLQDYICTTAVGTDKSSYISGETVMITGSGAFINGTGSSGWTVIGTCDMQYPTATFDTAVGGAMSQLVATGLQTLPVNTAYTIPSFSQSFIAPAATGSHYMALQLTVTPSGIPLTQGARSTIGNVTFTVTAPPPTVNIHFSSLLRSIKNSLVDSVSARTQ